MDTISKATIHMDFWRIHSKAPTMKNILLKLQVRPYNFTKKGL